MFLGLDNKKKVKYEVNGTGNGQVYPTISKEWPIYGEVDTLPVILTADRPPCSSPSLLVHSLFILELRAHCCISV